MILVGKGNLYSSNLLTITSIRNHQYHANPLAAAFWHGIFPDCASLYSDESGTRRYCAVSSIVITSGVLFAMFCLVVPCVRRRVY